MTKQENEVLGEHFVGLDAGEWVMASMSGTDLVAACLAARGFASERRAN